MRIFSGHRGPVRCLAYSPDGRMLASGSEDGTVRLWDAATAEGRGILRGHSGYVAALAFSPDGQVLATAGSADSVVKLWALSGAVVEQGAIRMGQPGVRYLRFAPDGSQVAVANRGAYYSTSVTLYRFPDGAATEYRREAAHGLAVSPDGALFAYGNEAGPIHFWAPRTQQAGRRFGRARALFGHTTPPLALAFRGDGATLVSAAPGELKRWDVESGRELPTGESPPSSAVPLVFTATGALLAAGGQEGVVRVWDVEAGRERAAFDWGIGPVYTAAFAPDGMTAAAAGRDFQIIVWDLED